MGLMLGLVLELESVWELEQMLLMVGASRAGSGGGAGAHGAGARAKPVGGRGIQVCCLPCPRSPRFGLGGNKVCCL